MLQNLLITMIFFTPFMATIRELVKRDQGFCLPVYLSAIRILGRIISVTFNYPISTAIFFLALSVIIF